MKLKSPGRARPAAGSRSSGAKAIQPDTGSTELDPASDPALRELGNELQRELDTYKRENAAIKAIRKQQETALAEITLQRNKV